MDNNGYEIFGDKTNNDIGFAADPVVRGMAGLLSIEGGGLLCKARVDLFSSRKSYHGVI